MIKRVVWLAGVLVLASAGVRSDAPLRVPNADPPLDLYQRGDAGEAIRCYFDHLPVHCGSRSGNGPTGLYADCSDAQYDCVVSSGDVIAVPKSGVTPGQKYQAFGAMLSVEHCFFENEDDCAFAQISSRCADDAVCSCRLADLGRKTTYFYYSKSLGVTAFYTLPENLAQIGVDASTRDAAIPLLTYVLIAEKGFLRYAPKIPRASLRTNCEN